MQKGIDFKDDGLACKTSLESATLRRSTSHRRGTVVTHGPRLQDIVKGSFWSDRDSSAIPHDHGQASHEQSRDRDSAVCLSFNLKHLQ